MATITWTGNAGDNLWLNPANWSSGDTPSSLDTVVINTQFLGANGPRGWGPTIGGLVLGPNTTLSVYGGPATASLNIGTVGTGAISGGVIYAFNGKITAGTGVTSASGVVVLDQNASYRWDGINSTQTIRMHYHPYLGVPVSPNVTFAFSTQFDGTIENFYATNIITYAGTGTVTGMTLNGHTVTYTTTAGSYTLTFGNDVNVADLIFNSGTGSITTLQVDPNVPCFTPGTLIRTERGDIAVETLDVGDMVVTASGEHRPIIWLGHHTMKRDGSAEFQSACPVRIQAGAFGDQMPYADLWLSPGHAICVRILDEVLIPAGYLINGATIAQVDVDEVTYWHVELGSHDILLANGL
ncbi:Hint domain-containing protein, partial [Phyllobacterium sp. OV277]|uniref:Hint domain-containing protein n=1 Tax=Phyllobacterium sp. OV277 TaxID=1882772 RepID=UPI00087E4B62